MKLTDLFSLRRYRRCRELFQSPLAAHLHLAWARRRPINLPLASGNVLRLPDVRKSRAMLKWVLQESQDAGIRSIRSDLVELEHGDFRVGIPASGECFFAFSEVFLRDCYQLNAIRRPLGTVVDLGANIGLFAVRVAPLAQHVICVEPVRANLKIARENIRRAQADEKVTFYKRAAAGASGRTERMFLSKDNRGGHSIRPQHAARWGEAGFEDVSTISLAELFECEDIERCSFLKCDVEGAEFEIFSSTPSEVLTRIDQLAMEVHFTIPEWGIEQLTRLRAKLKDAGFQVRHESIHDQQGQLKPVVMLHARRSL
ncbi:MAG: FkbM family methyltransferase [Pirellulaceae bacterium]